MNKFRLKEVCKIYQPKTISKKDIIEGKYPVYGANGIIDYHVDYNHKSSEVVVGCRGIYPAVHLTKEYSWINGNAMVITPLNIEQLSKKYLFYYLKSVDLTKYQTGSAIHQITKTTIQELEIKLPSLEEQEKIVEILNTIDTMRDTMRDAMINAEKLLDSLLDIYLG